jgi:hypothetical protein
VLGSVAIKWISERKIIYGKTAKVQRPPYVVDSMGEEKSVSFELVGTGEVGVN